jgi:hypothetical protein
MRLKKPVGIAVVMLLAVPSAGAGEWSEWGGSPDKNMVAKETGLPVDFSAGEESADSTGIDLATAKHCKWVVKLGSGLSNGGHHVQTNLPTAIAGSAGGAIKTGHHTKYAPNTPISKLWLSMGRL